MSVFMLSFQIETWVKSVSNMLDTHYRCAIIAQKPTKILFLVHDLMR